MRARKVSRGREEGGGATKPHGEGKRRPRARADKDEVGLSLRKRMCGWCTEGAKEIDYKQADLLRRFITDRGKIKTRRKTGLCARHQRQLALAVKRARHIALLPFTPEHARGS